MKPKQLERLALLAEELGESIQAIGKIMRHGYDSRHPSGGPSNRENLENELGNVLYAIELLCEGRDITTSNIKDACHSKASSVMPYLHHNKSLARVVAARCADGTDYSMVPSLAPSRKQKIS